MFDWPISSPKMTRIFGRLPAVGVGAGAGCVWARVVCPIDPRTDAAARLVLPSRRLRRSKSRSALMAYSLADDAAKAGMAGRGVDWLGVSCRRAIAAAIIRRP